MKKYLHLKKLQGKKNFLGLLLSSFALLANKGFVDVRNDTTASNGGLDEGVQFFVTTDGKLQMSGSDTLHLQILGGVTGQLENL